MVETAVMNYEQRLERLPAAFICLMLLFAASLGLSRAQTKAAARARRNQPSRGKVKERPGMAYIPSAIYGMGTDPADISQLQQVFGIKRGDLFAAEVPQHTVTLSPFYLDRHEVTNAQFKRFVDSSPEWRPGRIPAKYHNGNYLKHWIAGSYPTGQADHPVVNVSWYAAAAFCRQAGKRLPTEAEWEYAARGGLLGKQFPWGDELPDKTRANFQGSGVGSTVPVGSYPPNGYGLYDMAGNVWEYLADEWGSYAAAPQVDPVAGGSRFTDESYLSVTGRRVIRGGSWGGSPVNLRVAYRDSHPSDGAREFVGFRCAASAPKRGVH
jgi:formylglycine-generating enzyme required for sulfatase activity